MSRIEELEKRLAADPNSRMFVQLAEEYRKAGLLEQAIDVCEKGLKKHPQYPSARVALGRALLESGVLDRAGTEFEAVLKQVPDNILANRFLGETYERLGRLDEALGKYRVAHSLAPEDPELSERIHEVQASLARGGAGLSAPPTPPPSVAPPSAPPGQVEAPAVPPPPLPEPALRPPPAPPSSFEPEFEGETADEPPPRLIDELAPIPLVEVDEPMVLENRDYVPPPPVPGSESPPSTPSQPPPPPSAFEEIEPEAVFEPEPLLAEPAPAKAPAPPSPPSNTARSAAEIETPTMAEIYASQGHIDQAIAVYQKIVEQKPSETKYRERLDELRMLASATEARDRKNASSGNAASNASGLSDASAASTEGREQTIRVLQQWLEAIRKSKGA